MEQRGRKSTENLSVVVSIPGQRPEPLESLRNRERAIWKRVTACHPPGWFVASTHILLADYCRAWVHADNLAQVLDKYEGVPTEGLGDWLKLVDRQDRNARLLCTLATKMRMSHQAQRTDREAATGVRATAQEVHKPWEFGSA